MNFDIMKINQKIVYEISPISPLLLRYIKFTPYLDYFNNAYISIDRQESMCFTNLPSFRKIYRITPTFND